MVGFSNFHDTVPLTGAALVIVLTNIIALMPIPETDGAVLWPKQLLFRRAV
jgi:hypothetical protein